MIRKVNFVTNLHQQTSRDCLARMLDEKVKCMEIACKYGKEFWDGDRKYGYGGYSYDGRWASVAKAMISHYDLPENARILDVGCGKGYLLYEFLQLLPDAKVVGFDISSYALEHAHPAIKDMLLLHSAEDDYPFEDNEFDLIVSLTTLHNLPIMALKKAILEIERVGKEKYILVEGYRNKKELFNLQCWALTCETFFTPQEWEWFLKEASYNGDYECIFF